jgi:hypothetical protein
MSVSHVEVSDENNEGRKDGSIRTDERIYSGKKDLAEMPPGHEGNYVHVRNAKKGGESEGGVYTFVEHHALLFLSSPSGLLPLLRCE